MAAEEEDPVVAEYDVMLSLGMEEWAYLLRYPNHPVARVAPKPVEARLRSRNDVLELEYNTWHSAPGSEKYKHFDMGGGSVNMSDKAMRDQEEKHKTQTMRSARMNCDGRAYAMGIVDNKENKFHLVPLQGLYEMKPVLQGVYTTSGDELLEDEEPKIVEPKPIEPTPINVVNFRKQSQRAQKDSQRLTYRRMTETENKEDWLKLHIVQRDSESSLHTYRQYQTSDLFKSDDWIEDLSSESSDGEDKEEAESEREGVKKEDGDANNAEGSTNGNGKVTRSANGEPKVNKREVLRNRREEKRRRAADPNVAFMVSKAKYLDDVAPQTRLVGRTVPVGGGDGTSAGTAVDLVSRKVSLEDQIKQKLVRRGVLMLSEILPSAQVSTGGKTQRKTLDLLPKYAHLVRGAWVLKSQEYCREQFGEVDDEGGADLAKKCAVRDLLLGLIAKSETGKIKKDVIKEVGVKVSPGELQSALHSMCTFDKDTKLWSLKNIDKEAVKFQKSHAKLVSEQRKKLRDLMEKALIVLNVSPPQAKKHADAMLAAAKKRDKASSSEKKPSSSSSSSAAV